MKIFRQTLVILACVVVVGCTTPPAGHSAPTLAKQSNALELPIKYVTLDNGLRVVIAEDDSVPTATVAVYYNIGFRIEPRDRTGFAHLFEHMMFQGSEKLGKLEFINLIQSNGGVLNGSTRFDFTNYFEVVPANKLEPILWAEADRMKGLDITQENLSNQQGVVKNEVKVNVLNQPYGGFPWLDIPAYANENWHNNHNFYGDLEDLDAATVADVQNFFDTYYSPNNAVLAVVGDIDTAKTLSMVKQYFGELESAQLPPPVDISEPRQIAEKRAHKVYPKAPRPAIAFAYHMPERNTPEYFAMAVIDQIILQGNDSQLYQRLVKQDGYSSSVSGGINLLGNMYNYYGPMNYYFSLIHDEEHSSDDIINSVDSVIERLRTQPVSNDDIAVAKTKMRSSLYSLLGGASKFGVADLLASFALFDDDPGRINRLESEFDQVTPALILSTAQEYLRPTNRLVLEVTNGNPVSDATGATP